MTKVIMWAQKLSEIKKVKMNETLKCNCKSEFFVYLFSENSKINFHPRFSGDGGQLLVSVDEADLDDKYGAEDGVLFSN